MPIEVAHINRASTRHRPEIQRRLDVSLCHDHHTESHQGERSFEARSKIDLVALARSFYEHSPYRRRLDNPWDGS
jgi:hypothetical protein